MWKKIINFLFAISYQVSLCFAMIIQKNKKDVNLIL